MANLPSFVTTGYNGFNSTILRQDVDTHHIQGYFQHPDNMAMTGQKVKVYANYFFLFNVYIGEFETDRDGHFHLNYHWSRLPWQSIQNLTFKIFEEREDVGNLWFYESRERLVYETTVQKPLDSHHFKCGRIEAELYEYQDKFPALLQPENKSWSPQQWALGYNVDLATAGLGATVKSFFLDNIKPKKTMQGVQNAFPPHDPTLEVEEKSTLEMITNGIYPCNFRRGREPGKRFVELNWDRYDKDIGNHPQVSNIRLYLSEEQVKSKFETENVELSIDKVGVQFPGKGWQYTTPNHPSFKRFLATANSMFLLKGEVVSHLGIGHLWAEQAAMAIKRGMNKNPIYTGLLNQHISGVIPINDFGASQIFNEGALSKSGLSPKGVEQVMSDVLSGLDYTTFTPRIPLNDNHRFAIAENIWWHKVVVPTVDRFMKENYDEILNHWYEVYDMSQNLVNHSLPYRPWEGVADRREWINPNEIDDPSVPGRDPDNPRAVRPITSSRRAPNEGDLKRLHQFCCDVIFKTTFWHTVIHKSQGKWGSNFTFSSLAPDNDSRGKFLGTDPDHGREQAVIIDTLTKFDMGGTILANEEGRIYQPLIDNAEKVRREMQAQGFPIEEIFHSIFI